MTETAVKLTKELFKDTIGKEETLFLRPLGRRILVLPDDHQHKGRIVIPDVAKRKTTTGHIIAFGEPHDLLKVGDRILYDRFGGTELCFEAEAGKPERSYRMVSFDEVLAIVKDDSMLKE